MATKKENKTADMTKYRAEYYATKSESIIERTSNNYYKRKYGLTDEDLVAFGEHSLDAGKAIHILRNLKTINPDLVQSIITKV
jgi:hypothetical protein